MRPIKEMGGIFASYGKHGISVAMHDLLSENLDQLRPRGPNHRSIFFDAEAFIGSWNSKNETEITMQKNCVCVYDGDIFNVDTLQKRYNISVENKESIIHLMYDTYLGELLHDNVKYIASHLDGEFACILYNPTAKVMHAFRDPYGTRPLFYGLDHNERIYFASEAKALISICTFIEQVTPGFVMTVSNTAMITHYSPYHPICLNRLNFISTTFPDAFFFNNLKYYLFDSVRKRINNKSNAAILLSGGLNSSLIAASLAHEVDELHTFSIGLPGSSDLSFAAQVAKHIHSTHHAITCTFYEYIDAVQDVICAIESYDVTTVRASIVTYLIAKGIKDRTNIRDVFTGDFANEIMSGHAYFEKAPNALAFHNETVRLLGDITYFDGLRCDRTLAAHGINVHYPFADKAFVEFYLQIPPEMRMSYDKYDKYMLRKAFEFDNILPEAVLWRKKETIVDGMSSIDNPLANMIYSFIDSIVSDEEYVMSKKKYDHNTPHTKEAYYYRKIFESFYQNHDNIIPYTWNPKWVVPSNYL